MPRSINPGSLTVGSGTAPAGTVEDSSVASFGKAADPVRAHTQDPIRSHMASTTGLVDAGLYFVSDEAEGALQELGALSATIPLDRQNGWYEAGVQDFDTAVTDAGLNITLAGTWVAVTSLGRVTVSGDVFAIPANVTHWVFVHGTTGVITSQVGTPDITTLEHVIIGRFTTNGANVTVKEDARFFLRNDNRKITYSVRADNAAADANSEGSFFSLEGAFLWLSTYSSGTVSKKTKLILRGPVTVGATLSIPVDNFELVGEDSAEIILSAGAPTNLFNTNGKSYITIERVKLSCNITGSTAIFDNAVSVNGVYLNRVSVASGTGTWLKGVSFTGASSVGVNVQFSEFTVAAANGVAVYLKSATQCTLHSLKLTYTGGGGGPGSGIVVGDKSGGGALGIWGSVTNCSLTGFVTYAIQIFSKDFEVRGNVISQTGGSGIYISEGSSSGVVSGNEISGTPSIAINLLGNDLGTDRTTGISVQNNTLSGFSTSGISLSGFVRQSSVISNLVDGWLGGAEPSSAGIKVFTNGVSVPTSVVVSENNVRRCFEGIVVQGLYDTRASATITVSNYLNFVSGVSTITIGGVVLTAVAPGPAVGSQFVFATNNDTTAANIAAAINNTTLGFYASICRATVLANVITLYAADPGALGNSTTLATNAPTAATLAAFSGGLNLSVEGVIVDSNVIANCFKSKAGLGPDTFTGAGCKGIGLEHTFGCRVSNNDIREIGIMLDDSGTPTIPVAGGIFEESIGIYSRNSSRLQVLGNSVYNTAKNNATAFARGIYLYQGSAGVEPMFAFICTGNVVSGNTISWDLRGNGGTLKITGQLGVDFYLDNGSDAATSGQQALALSIVGNTVSSPALWGARLRVGNLSTLGGFDISGNSFKDAGSGVDTGGIGLFVADLGGAVAGSSVIELGSITGNNIPGSLGDGIALSGNRSTGPNLIHSLDITKNIIPVPVRSGVNFVVGINTLTLSDIRITDNVILSAGAAGAFPGILVQNTAASLAAFRRIFIQRNSVGGSLNATVPAISVANSATDSTGIHVDDNVVDGSSGAASAGLGILVSITGSDHALVKSSFNRNRVYSTYDGLKVTHTGVPISLEFNGNEIEVTDPVSRPLWVETNKTTAPGGEFNGRFFSIQDNILRGGRGSLFHVLRGVKIRSLTVAHNIFSATLDGTAQTTGASAGFAFILDAAAGMGTTTLASASVRDLIIEGNSFQDCQEEGLVLNLGIGVTVPGVFVDAGFATGIIVKGNGFSRTALDADGIGGAFRILSCAAIRDLSIDGNTFDTGGMAASATDGIIQIDFMSNNVVSLGNVSISQNSCGGSTIAFIKLKEYALKAVAAATPYSNVRNLRVCGNQLTEMSASFFWGNFADTLQSYILENISVEGNSVGLIGGGQNGMTLTLDGDLSGLSVSRNKFSGVYDTGVSVAGTAGDVASLWDWVNVSYDGNEFQNFSVSGISHVISTGSGDIYSRNERYTNNLFYSAGVRTAIVCTHNCFSAGALWEGLNVEGNLANIDDANAVFLALSTNITPAAAKRAWNIIGNTTVDVGYTGTYAGAGAVLTNLVIAHNVSHGAVAGGVWGAAGVGFVLAFGAATNMQQGPNQV